MTDFTLRHAEAVAEVICKTATEHVLPYFRAPDRIDVRQKTGPGDLVTAADLACERALTPALSAFLPGSVVVGEEATAADKGILTRLRGDDPVWIIDPVDGTMNFANGRRQFAVLVALALGDRTLAGWIYDPCAARSSWAVRGLGCYTDGAPVRLALPADGAAVGPDHLSGAISSRFCDEALGRRLRRRARKLGRHLSLGSAGQEYLHLIDGHIQASLYHRLMPWDHAAGVLLFEEAGGYVALVEDESPYAPFAAIDRGGLLSAVNRATWRTLRDYLYAPPDDEE